MAFGPMVVHCQGAHYGPILAKGAFDGFESTIAKSAGLVIVIRELDLKFRGVICVASDDWSSDLVRTGDAVF